eukprot:TRINITY_DN3860_c0_g1_i1.p2 TRINITY_DN3860_c0_g1~~TRINITY_DN3860_c0_g1_i1.p2  ORF type:complete len:272 (+),score=45.72 TRINITY_DN3860_c0_g1_i1:35-817(+)
MKVDLRFVTGRSLPLTIPAPTQDSLRAEVSRSTGLPTDSFDLYAVGGSCNDNLVVHCVPRLRAGKGGFGSMLRSLGKKQAPRTTNFDACRDLTGRRIRHVNQEKQLAGWTPGHTKDPKLVAFDLTKKDLIAVEKKIKAEDELLRAKAKQVTKAELKQRELEAKMSTFTAETAKARQAAQEAVQVAIKNLKKPEKAEESSADEGAQPEASLASSSAVGSVPGKALPPKQSVVRPSDAMGPPAKRRRLPGMLASLSASECSE